ncbi:GAF domain-containing sensor histidine kinase [Dictyobacter arantiisoli]|uniref:histidine kinase n=1 Tax=Dictyobacter arantiisoli TaxID=2014874 RepID=A0A5A5TEF2_9CHLR|nr:GAF domain-containing sensor histidine kinase [Dictyobacter arantiisoli]GCF09707.1 hypothetical protein KDI_32710 [Dictyobacter arantiisoli]
MNSHSAFVHDCRFLEKVPEFSNDSLPLLQAVQKIVRNVSALFPSACCTIALLVQSGTSLLSFSSTQTVSDGWLEVPFRYGEGVAGWVVQHAEPLATDDATVLDGCVTTSLFAVPLLYEQICIGTLTITYSDRIAFDAAARQLLTVLADQASLTIWSVQQANAQHMATRSRANFLSMLTHELRSPLNAINGYLELTLSGVGGDLNEQQRDFVQRARASSENLYALLEDLLLISRADAGQMRLNREIIRLPEIIENAVEELELTAADNGIQIHVAIEPDFPHLYADAVRLQQVLRNLINNGLQFTSVGGEVTITASVIETGHALSSSSRSDFAAEDVEDDDDSMERMVRLQVQDTGCGIAPEFQQQIFERFFQAPNERVGHAGGQGLGLAIIKMIVELHGGTISVESVVGQGSTFTCLLPCLLS